MVAPPRHTMTAQEYLVFERAHEWKHEYFRGNITAMPLVTVLHAQIVGNTAVMLHQTLRGHCSVLMSAMRMKVEAADFYACPDIIVVCGPAELADEHQDIVLNPTSSSKSYRLRSKPTIVARSLATTARSNR